MSEGLRDNGPARSELGAACGQYDRGRACFFYLCPKIAQGAKVASPRTQAASGGSADVVEMSAFAPGMEPVARVCVSVAGLPPPVQVPWRRRSAVSCVSARRSCFNASSWE